VLSTKGGVMARIRPSKPVAAFGAVFGLAILIWGGAAVGGSAGGFLWIWVAAGLAIIAVNLWVAFGRRGAVQVIENDDRRARDRAGQ
jgi:hypothetical protein